MLAPLVCGGVRAGQDTDGCSCDGLDAHPLAPGRRRWDNYERRRHCFTDFDRQGRGEVEDTQHSGCRRPPVRPRRGGLLAVGGGDGAQRRTGHDLERLDLDVVHIKSNALAAPAASATQTSMGDAAPASAQAVVHPWGSRASRASAGGAPLPPTPLALGSTRSDRPSDSAENVHQTHAKAVRNSGAGTGR